MKQFSLPSAAPLEEAVVGAVLLDIDAIYQVIQILKPEHLINPVTKTVYQACINLFQRGAAIDLLTAAEEVRAMGKLEQIGGAYNIVELTNKVASSANILHHTRLILQSWMRREVIAASSTLKSDAFNPAVDVFDLVQRAELRLEGIKDATNKGKQQTNSDIIFDLDKQIQRNKERGSMGSPIWGVDTLDNFMNGADEEDFIIMAGDSSMGKSSLVNSAVIHCIKNNIPAAFWSLEMSNKNTVARALSGLTKIPFIRIMINNIYPEEEALLQRAKELVAESPIHFFDEAGINVLDFRAKITTLIKKHGIKVAFLDRLGLLDDLPNTGRLNTAEVIGANTKILRGACNNLGIPIVALNQLTKAVREAPNCVPNRRFLYGSSKIANDATKIIFVYRPEFYGIELDENNESTKGAAYFIVDKNSNGPTGTVKGLFNAECMHFYNKEDEDFKAPEKVNMNNIKSPEKIPF